MRLSLLSLFRSFTLVIALFILAAGCSKNDAVTPVIDQLTGTYACSYIQTAATSVGTFTSPGATVLTIAKSGTNSGEVIVSYTVGSSQQNFDATINGTVITIKSVQSNPGITMKSYSGSGLYDAGKLTLTTTTVNSGGTVITNDFSGKKQ